MIVLRLHIRGRRHDVQSTEPRLVLGSDPEAADVVQADVGWAPTEAVLVHHGTEVELQRPSGQGNLRLRVGDSVRLGHARIALIGLLPLPDVLLSGEDLPAEGALFGGYPEEELDPSPPPAPPGPAGPSGPSARSFAIEGEAPQTPPQTPPQMPPPPPRAPAPAPAADPAASTQPLRAPPPSQSTPGRTATPKPGTKPGAKPGAKAAPRTAPPPPGASQAPAAKGTKRPEDAKGPKGQPPLRRPPSPAFRHPDFGEELVRQIKRAPFFAISLAAHALLFLVLTLLQTTETPGAKDGEGGTLQAALQNAADHLDYAESPLDDIEELDAPDIPEVPDEVVIPDPETPEQEKSEEGQHLEELLDDSPLPFPVGVNPSLSSAKAGEGTARPKLAPAELKQPFSKGDAANTNRKASEFILSDLGVGTGRRGSPLDSLARADLLVVDGAFDKVGKVLYTLQLPFLRVSPVALSLPKAPDLSQHKVIFWNCGESLPPDRRKLATRRLRAFVKDGGYLFTTDWSVSNVILEAFPGFLGTSGPRAPLSECVIDIHPARGQKLHPLLKGVFPRGAQGRWWLEQASFDVKILKPSAVTSLIESTELKELYGRTPVVAATFPYGHGRVLHVMGHYYQEEGNLAGTISAQRLALNFILERLAKD